MPRKRYLLSCLAQNNGYIIIKYSEKEGRIYDRILDIALIFIILNRNFFYPPLGAYVVKFITSPKRIGYALIMEKRNVCI